MGDMPGNVAKGPVLYYLDKLSRDNSGETMSKDKLKALLLALQELSGPGGLADIFKTHLFDRYQYIDAEKARNHLHDDWFDGSSKGMWRAFQPIEPIFRKGYIDAIGEAIYKVGRKGEERPENLPINSYWVCAGYHFEMVVGQSFDQVTLLVLTPGPEKTNIGLARPVATAEEKSRIWVVRRDTLRTHGTPLKGEQIPGIGQKLEGGWIEDEIPEYLTVRDRILTVRMG